MTVMLSTTLIEKWIILYFMYESYDTLKSFGLILFLKTTYMYLEND